MQMADDLTACTKYLLKKYNKDKAIIVGYSIGATAAWLLQQETAAFSASYLWRA